MLLTDYGQSICQDIFRQGRGSRQCSKLIDLKDLSHVPNFQLFLHARKEPRQGAQAYLFEVKCIYFLKAQTISKRREKVKKMLYLFAALSSKICYAMATIE